VTLAASAFVVISVLRSPSLTDALSDDDAVSYCVCASDSVPVVENEITNTTSALLSRRDEYNDAAARFLLEKLKMATLLVLNPIPHSVATDFLSTV
jgi:hypothetical protein